MQGGPHLILPAFRGGGTALAVEGRHDRDDLPSFARRARHLHEEGEDKKPYSAFTSLRSAGSTGASVGVAAA